MKLKKLLLLPAIAFSTSILSGCALIPTVTWVNWDGTILEVDKNVFFGSVPTYDGSVPTKPSTPEFNYKFKGWNKEVSKAWLLHIEYKAEFDEIKRSYKVIWEDTEFGQLKEEMVPYGVTPQYTPSHASDAQYDYEFAGWDKDPAPVTGDVTYTTTFVKHVKSYEIKFIGFGGTLLKSEVVEYGKMPTPPENIPLGIDEKNVYTFKGWDREIVKVSGTTTYQATYSSRERKVLNLSYYIDGVQQDSGVYEDAILEYSTLTLPTYTPTDYYDVEWFLTKEFEESSRVTDNKVNLGEETISLYGKKIEEHKFNITYILGEGGSFPTDKYPQVVTYSQTIDFNALQADFDKDAPRLSEHMFDGWVNEKDEKVDVLSNVTNDIVLKATYKVQKYTLYFDWPSLATTSFEVTYNSEDYLKELSKDIYIPEWLGYTFVGWSLDYKNVVSGPYLYSKDMALSPIFIRNSAQ